MKIKPNQPQIALALLATLFILVTLGPVSTVTAQDIACRPTVSVRCSPKSGATDKVVKELSTAQSQILMQDYNFSSAPIATALVNAAKRGVKVTAVLDRSNQTAKYSATTFLKNAGVPTFIDDKHAIAHNKILIIDQGTVLTGSFNFTKKAEDSNAENLLTLKDCPELVQVYTDEFIPIKPLVAKA